MEWNAYKVHLHIPAVLFVKGVLQHVYPPTSRMLLNKIPRFVIDTEPTSAVGLHCIGPHRGFRFGIGGCTRERHQEWHTPTLQKLMQRDTDSKLDEELLRRPSRALSCQSMTNTWKG